MKKSVLQFVTVFGKFTQRLFIPIINISEFYSGERTTMQLKLRVISLLMAIVLTLLLIPVPASAVSTEAAELENQIRNTYRMAQRYSYRYSFNGYCGSLVNWQTYLLGIDTTKYGCDGKDEYDLYSNMGTTTGGYRVKCYPASQYDLRSALNAITRNGTVDAYNILVGFQKTNTAMGSIYGHAMMIHGIIDGVVYFMECYNTSLGGKYWAEGAPISCSIDTFCDYYNRWTVFEGVIYFGMKTYADSCKEYPAGMYALATNNTPIYSEPADPGIYEGTLSGESLVSGEIVKVTALLETPGGGYWYQLDRNGAAEYVPAEKLMRIEDNCDDLGFSDLQIPTAIRKNYGFVLRGTVSSLNSHIKGVTVRVYSTEEGKEEPLMEGSLEAEGRSINLNTWKLDKALPFRQLKPGTYRIVITAEAQTYVLKDGSPKIKKNVLTLWDSAFQVVADWKSYYTVSFDGNGGESEIRQTVVANGAAVGTLPEATRPGYVFAGWSLDPQGKQLVNGEQLITEDVTLYAQWQQGGDSISGWYTDNGKWNYYEDGISVGGTINDEESNRAFIVGWHAPGGALVAASVAVQEVTPCSVAQETKVPVETQGQNAT